MDENPQTQHNVSAVSKVRSDIFSRHDNKHRQILDRNLITEYVY